MSLYAAMSAGVSGLSAFSSAAAAVSDNITNSQTIGYKTSIARFGTLVSGGSDHSGNAGGGVTAATRSLISSQGQLQSTASSTDLGIEGGGFFIVRSSPAAGADVSFTRAGSFSPDSQGYLRNDGGLYLQGWRLDANGQYVNTGNTTSLEPVRVSDLAGTAAPTKTIAMRANLSAAADVYTGPYAAGDMASGAVTPQFSRSIDVYDGQGVAHRVTLDFLKTGTNSWSAEVAAVPATDVTAPGGLVASGNVAFNPDGTLNIAGSSPALFQPLSIGWTNGAATVPISLKLGSDGASDGLSQFGGESALISASSGGGLLGNIESISVSKAGVVSAVFADGSTRNVFQLPLASFANPDGLKRLANNAYLPSSDSGVALINPPGSAGAGDIQSSALESSTTDLGQELASLIVVQRAYSASTKIITTADEMLQELTNLKR